MRISPSLIFISLVLKNSPPNPITRENAATIEQINQKGICVTDMFVGPSPPLTNRRPPPRRLTTTALPDLFLAAFSLLFLCSSPRPLPPPNRFSFRRSTTTTMSRLSPPKRFTNAQSLSDWLQSRLPSDSFATWGVKPGTKNVHNLWLELSEGETSLDDTTPPVRTVNVVTVRVIKEDGSTLVESRQELSDGSVRERNRPLSEKMKPSETPDEAVLRAIKEELGSIFNDDDDVERYSRRVKVIPGTYSRKVEERNSLSYPGLPARYALHSVDATVEGLPEEDFVTEEKEYGGDSAGAVTVKRHFWKWVRPDSVKP